MWIFKTYKLLKEIRVMLQSILDLITKIAADLDAISTGSITPAQAQQIKDALTAVASKADSLVPLTPPTPPVA